MKNEKKWALEQLEMETEPLLPGKIQIGEKNFWTPSEGVLEIEERGLNIRISLPSPRWEVIWDVHDKAVIESTMFVLNIPAQFHQGTDIAIFHSEEKAVLAAVELAKSLGQPTFHNREWEGVWLNIHLLDVLNHIPDCAMFQRAKIVSD